LSSMGATSLTCRTSSVDSCNAGSGLNTASVLGLTSTVTASSCGTCVLSAISTASAISATSVTSIGTSAGCSSFSGAASAVCADAGANSGAGSTSDSTVWLANSCVVSAGSVLATSSIGAVLLASFLPEAIAETAATTATASTTDFITPFFSGGAAFSATGAITGFSATASDSSLF